MADKERDEAYYEWRNSVLGNVPVDPVHDVGSQQGWTAAWAAREEEVAQFKQFHEEIREEYMSLVKKHELTLAESEEDADERDRLREALHEVVRLVRPRSAVYALAKEALGER
jgi:hypothetical protein